MQQAYLCIYILESLALIQVTRKSGLITNNTIFTLMTNYWLLFLKVSFMQDFPQTHEVLVTSELRNAGNCMCANVPFFQRLDFARGSQYGGEKPSTDFLPPQKEAWFQVF